ncbi:MAG: hypothetical protein PHW46_06780 [Candidatus Omnitrophica bacterium]|nr:hypothetical protein [Candidatus Omnitrophota bacterium]
MKKFKYLINLLVVSVSLLCLQGCFENEAELEKKILDYDPSYQSVLDQRNVLRNELSVLQSIFQGGKKEIEDKINILKYRRSKLIKEYTVKSDKLKKQIVPKKKELSLMLGEMRKSYSEKSREISLAEKSIKEMSTLMGKKETLSLTHEELQSWKDKKSLLIENKQKLYSEKSKLEKEMKIIKLKIKVLTV